LRQFSRQQTQCTCSVAGLH